jgi:hypothetical protein
LKQVGWVWYLKEKNPERLRAAVKLLDTSEEPELQAIIKSFGQIVSITQSIAILKVVGINTLFKVN